MDVRSKYPPNGCPTTWEYLGHKILSMWVDGHPMAGFVAQAFCSCGKLIRSQVSGAPEMACPSLWDYSCDHAESSR